MPRDPRNRIADDGAQAERPSGLAPEEVSDPALDQKAADADWLSMATADPALFLKDTDAE